MTNNSCGTRDNQTIFLGKHIACDGLAEEFESFLIISHAHGDHYKERFVRKNFGQKKPLIISEPTRDLLNCFGLNIKFNAGVYAQEFNKKYPYDTLNGEKIWVRLKENKHILGSSQIEVEEQSGKKYGYSGDFNEKVEDTINVDTLVLDATYGAKNDSKIWTMEECLDELVQRMKEAYAKGSVFLEASPGLLQFILSKIGPDLFSEMEYIITARKDLPKFNKVYRDYGFQVPDVYQQELDTDEWFKAIRTRHLRLGYHRSDFPDTPKGTYFYVKNFGQDNTEMIKKDKKNVDRYNVSLTCHAMGDEILNYVERVKPELVITDGSRKEKSSRLLAKKIEKELRIQSKSSLDL